MSILVMAEYKDLLLAGDTWIVTKFSVMLHHNIDGANPNKIELVQWMVPVRSQHRPHCTTLRICAVGVSSAIDKIGASLTPFSGHPW